MADLAESSDKIQEEDVVYSGAVSEALLTKFGGAINWLVANAAYQVGDVKHSALTEADFALRHGYDHTETDLSVKKWVIIDGQNISGSAYATLTGITTLPSGKSNEVFVGQKGDPTTYSGMLAYEPNQNQSHRHSLNGYVNTNNGAGATGVLPRIEWGDLATEADTWTGNDPDDTSKRGFADHSFSPSTGNRAFTFEQQYGEFMASNGGSVTRPNTLRVNIFLKIND